MNGQGGQCAGAEAYTGVSDSVCWLGAGSGSVTQLLCDFEQITFHLWASIAPSVKSLSLTECGGRGGRGLEAGEAVWARGRWARER